MQGSDVVSEVMYIGLHWKGTVFSHVCIGLHRPRGDAGTANSIQFLAGLKF